jgi:S-adenosylhomocysteine hydrolase
MKKKFEDLELLNSFIPSEECLDVLCSQTLIVGVQHLLETTGSLFEKICSFGVPPNNFYIAGKTYSTNKEVKKKMLGSGFNIISVKEQSEPRDFELHMIKTIEALWLRVAKCVSNNFEIRNIIILEDGGRCLTLMPKQIEENYNTFAVEQTTSGLERLKKTQPKTGVISVANAKTKLRHESPLIAAKAIEILCASNNIPYFESQAICIIGTGSIGSSLKRSMSNIFKNNIVSIDIKDFNDRGRYIRKLCSLVASSSVIIGCTGNDVSKLFDIKSLKGKKYFISLSSEDIEFRSLKNLYKREWVICGEERKDLSISNEQNNLSLFNCGYPLNFNNGRHSISPVEISLTRTLLLAGVCQAAELILSNQKHSTFVPLREDIQNEILEKWQTLIVSFSNP